MMNYRIQQDVFVCEMLEIKYARTMREKKDLDTNDYKILFPPNWFSITDCRKKIEILSEAIEKEILINDTFGYLDVCECVKDDYSIR